jgi:hypothetical protein
MRRIIFAGVLTGILGVPAFGQGVDPLIGTWKYNPQKSTGFAFTFPKIQILTWVAGEGGNLINTADTVDDQGRAFKATFLHTYDGMPHPTTNYPGLDSSTYTRSGNIINITRSYKGKQVQVAQAVIDPGKTYTLTAGGIDPLNNNQPYYFITVYDRQ